MKFLIFSFFCLSLTAFSQTSGRVCHKIAHVDVEYVLSVWEKVHNVDSIVYGEKLEYERQFEPTYKQYLEVEEAINSNKYEGIELEDKQLQYEQLQKRVQEFSYNAKRRLVNRQQELMKPLLERVKLSINDIAYEGDYDYIISSTSGDSSLVLFCKTDGDDVTEKLLMKLGIK
jgi:outer membrane protein